MPVLTSGSPPSLHSPGTSLYYSLLCMDQCLSLPKDLSACRLQFILHRTRRIFLKGGGEVSDLIITTNGAQGHKPIPSHTQAFLKSAPAYLLNSSSQLTVSYSHPQISHPNHIRNPRHSPKPSLPFGSAIPWHKTTPPGRRPSTLHGAFARALPPHTELTSPKFL